ncbi:SAF domain-containing protein [Streptomyces kronopolitis]|uniref:SAF domain-containing protein n=1 Tax=Streptomyces kronopolitis TaxID=1612435 RepID=UPI0036843259
MTKTSSPVPETGEEPHASSATGVSVGLQRRRRQPAMAALASAVIAAGGLVGFLAYSQTGHRTAVLAVSRSVSAGDVIGEADLSEVSVSLDPALKAYPAADRSKVVGKRAAVSLLPGAMLSRGQVSTRTLVGADEALVGIGLKAGQLPATRLSAGDRVQVVSTPPDGATEQSSKGDQARPHTIAARVVRVGPREQATGDVVVDVAVQAVDGPALASRAAGGNVALVVAPAGGGS